jgi:hypothetical protein
MLLGREREEVVEAVRKGLTGYRPERLLKELID